MVGEGKGRMQSGEGSQAIFGGTKRRGGRFSSSAISCPQGLVLAEAGIWIRLDEAQFDKKMMDFPFASFPQPARAVSYCFIVEGRAQGGPLF